MTVDKFDTNKKKVWCPGCGNFGINTAIKQAFVKLGLEPSDILITYGIGCHGHMTNYLTAYEFEGLHGRALPLAQGVKLANKNLSVIAMAGDGDQLSEGGNHLIHAARRNIDITCIIHDNQVYGLTVGQASPTSQKSYKSRSTPEGAVEEPINPLALAIASGASFAARGFAGDVAHLTGLFAAAIKHKGFAVVDVLQPCVSFNYINTYSWFQKRVYKLGKNHNVTDKMAALKKALQPLKKIPLGVFYKKQKPIFESSVGLLKKDKPLIDYSIDNINIEKLLKEFC